MTKKDYELIARVFFTHKKRYGFRYDACNNELIDDMADTLRRENTKFDGVRFLNACNGVCQNCGTPATSENSGNECKKCGEIVWSRY